MWINYIYAPCKKLWGQDNVFIAILRWKKWQLVNTQIKREYRWGISSEGFDYKPESRWHILPGGRIVARSVWPMSSVKIMLLGLTTVKAVYIPQCRGFSPYSKGHPKTKKRETRSKSTRMFQLQKTSSGWYKKGAPLDADFWWWGWGRPVPNGRSKSKIKESYIPHWTSHFTGDLFREQKTYSTHRFCDRRAVWKNSEEFWRKAY